MTSPKILSWLPLWSLLLAGAAAAQHYPQTASAVVVALPGNPLSIRWYSLRRSAVNANTVVKLADQLKLYPGKTANEGASLARRNVSLHQSGDALLVRFFDPDRKTSLMVVAEVVKDISREVERRAGFEPGYGELVQSAPRAVSYGGSPAVEVVLNFKGKPMPEAARQRMAETLDAKRRLLLDEGFLTAGLKKAKWITDATPSAEVSTLVEEVRRGLIVRIYDNTLAVTFTFTEFDGERPSLLKTLVLELPRRSADDTLAGLSSQDLDFLPAAMRPFGSYVHYVR